MQIQLLEPGDTPITIAPPPVNADRKYPRLYFKGTGIQDDTAVDGHVDRYLDGTIQWTFVSLMFDLAPIIEINSMIQVSQYGNVIWMSVAVICGFS